MKKTVRDFFETLQDYATGNSVYSLVDGVEIGLRPSKVGEAVYIMKIRSSQRGEGRASYALQALCKLADEYQLDLFLEVEQSDGLNSEQLAEWYWRYGFRGNLKEMVRSYKTVDE